MQVTTLSLRVACAVALTTASAAYGAPTNRPARVGGRTAVIDLGHIFDNSIFVKAEIEKIRAEAEETTERFRTIETQLRRMAEELKQYNKGSQEYARLEAGLVQKQADARVQAQLQQKKLQEKRSKILFTAYQQIEELVRLYSTNNGITLVLRTNQVNADNPQTAQERMRRIQRPVVFEQNVDITLPILTELNRRAMKVSQNGRTNTTNTNHAVAGSPFLVP
ncbi:MAG: OmpH family outer membrane protein [Pirellulales bacterium]|nr:OmpH family outer membrane protein [Pirellulales bacterium]